MSSVTRFTRQIPVSTTYYSVPASVLAGTSVYEFVPTAANYVGNYPPGYVTATHAALNAALATAGTTATLVLRDMGKTIYAPVESAGLTSGYFRQVQLLLPSGISASQGFIGGTAGNTFGVLGGALTPDVYTNFMTFYIAAPVGGVLAGVLSGATPIAGGQM
jgi:hypothetical protein